MLLLVVSNLVAQSTDKLELLRTEYETCIETGSNLKNCASSYYTKINLILNDTYLELLNASNLKEKNKLSVDQKTWTLKRDVYFKSLLAEAKADSEGGPVTDESEMSMFDQKAEYVLDRIETLKNKVTKK